MKKKMIALLLCVILTAAFFAGCQTQCEHDYVSAVTRPAYGLMEGVMTYTCEKCGDTYTETIAATNSVKLLVIGPSFGVDSAAYLWNVFTEGGIGDVTIGVAYIGGSPLDLHWSNIQNDAADYEYHKNTSGNFNVTPGKTLLEILTDEQWDIITLQQTSPNHSKTSSFDHLGDIIAWIGENKTNPNALLYWNMPWAYSNESTDSVFLGQCGGDRQKMYEMIAGTIQKLIVPNGAFSGILPSGTVIQNMSNSYLDESELFRDDLHLSYDYGRYAVALAWYAVLFDGDVDQIDWVPLYLEHLSQDLPMIREAVKNAVAHPFEVTPCTAERIGEG